MKQPEYSPLEALERIKLMMKYDMSKTLNENKEVISELDINPSGAATTAIGAGAGYLAGAGFAAAATTGAGLGTLIPIPLVGTAIGALVGLGLAAFGAWVTDPEHGKEDFKELMNACSSKGSERLVKTLENSQIRQIAYAIKDSKGDFNDDEEAIVNALSSIPTVGDLCEVNKKLPGGLWGFLNDLTDSSSEWELFLRPIEGMIEDSKILMEPEKVKKSGTVKTTTTTTKYKPCSGTYTQGCYSEVIKQVQGCLGGLVADGKFGPKTNEKLKTVGLYGGFSDNDVKIICDKVNPAVSGEEIEINPNEY
jgi:hypothetical protein